jgi:hypothetical protein
MSISKVSAGEHLPHEFNVIIEIPMNADPTCPTCGCERAASLGLRGHTPTLEPEADRDHAHPCLELVL